MLLFGSRKDERAAQQILSRLLNKNCAELRAFRDGPRNESRVNLTIVVGVIPLVGKSLVMGEAFTATTKDASTSGLSIVTTNAYEGDRVAIAVESEEEMHFLRGEIRHREPLNGGFELIGVHMTGVLSPLDYPELVNFRLA